MDNMNNMNNMNDNTNNMNNDMNGNNSNAYGNMNNNYNQNGYNQNGYKRLMKSRNNRYICGVCGGIGEYFNIDPTLVRIGAVVLGCCGAGLLAYIIGAICMPEQ